MQGPAPAKHNTSTPCWDNAGPSSATLAQHCPNNGSMISVFLVVVDKAADSHDGF